MFPPATTGPTVVSARVELDFELSINNFHPQDFMNHLKLPYHDPQLCAMESFSEGHDGNSLTVVLYCPVKEGMRLQKLFPCPTPYTHNGEHLVVLLLLLVDAKEGTSPNHYVL